MPFLVRFEEKKLDDGALTVQRHPELSPRQPSPGREAQGRLKKSADFDVALDQAPLERRFLENSV